MVDVVAGAGDLGQRSPGGLGGGDHRVEELLVGDPARARRLHECSTGTHEAQRQVREAGVGTKGTVDVGLALGERRRVDDDEVVVAVGPGELHHHLERVADLGGERTGPDGVEVGVELHVVLGGGQGGRRQVDGVHRARATGGGVDAESARRGEDVEHVASRRHLTHTDAVRSLIEEVAGLLAGAHVGVELQARLDEAHRTVGQVAGDHVAVGEAERLAGLQVAGEAQHDARAVGDVEQGVHDGDEVREPDRRVQLDHEHTGVAVDDEPRDAVVLAVEQAIRELVGVGGVGEHDPLVEGAADRRPPPVAVDLRRLAGVEDPELDRRVGVVEGERNELAVVVEDHREVAGDGFVADRGDRLLEHPRMSGADVAQRVGCDPHGETLVARARHAQQPPMDRWAAHGWNDAMTPTSGLTSPP